MNTYSVSIFHMLSCSEPNSVFQLFILLLDQQLHVVHLEPAPREKCEEVSEVSPHTICTQEKSERSECNVS